MKIIKFSSQYNTEEWGNNLPRPKPALNYIPEAYKKLERYIGGHPKDGRKTVKTCVPFLDAMKHGYMIPFSTDISCWYDEKEQRMNFETHPNLIKNEYEFGVSSHLDIQVPEDLRYNRRTVDKVFKFGNTWHIKTPPGYSCFFTQPNNSNQPFQIIDGIVDTDTYSLIIAFPFYWTRDYQSPYMIKQGDPMVQVIPFKRDDWKATYGYYEDQKAQRAVAFTFSSWFENAYRKINWKKKTFK
tara:strand:- start:775 stop:1497 length:723 start_codon:yes stop_codon:yes gene_type:complete